MVTSNPWIRSRGQSVGAQVVSSHAGLPQPLLQVQDVSLEVPRGGIVSIIGPNGAGKTSLLNMISGFYKPDTGRVVLDGVDITQRKPSAVASLGIARTFQNIALFGGLTVLDNLMLYWLPATGASSARLYWENTADFFDAML